MYDKCVMSVCCSVGKRVIVRWSEGRSTFGGDAGARRTRPPSRSSQRRGRGRKSAAPAAGPRGAGRRRLQTQAARVAPAVRGAREGRRTSSSASTLGRLKLTRSRYSCAAGRVSAGDGRWFRACARRLTRTRACTCMYTVTTRVQLHSDYKHAYMLYMYVEYTPFFAAPCRPGSS